MTHLKDAWSYRGKTMNAYTGGGKKTKSEMFVTQSNQIRENFSKGDAVKAVKYSLEDKKLQTMK